MFGGKQTTTASTGFTFPQATTAPGSTMFGGGTAASTGFPSAQPQQQQGFSGFSFPQSQPATQPSTGFQLPTANTAAAPNVSLFGSTLGGQNKPIGFGTPQATTAQPSMGFGGLQATAAQPSMGFGTSLPTSAQPSLGFGTPQPTSVAQPTLGFGTQQATSAAQPTLGFGTPQATSAAQPTLSFGTSQASSTPLSFGFNAQKTTPAPATTATTGFSFGIGTPATTASATPAPTLNFGLGTNPTTTSTPTLAAATSAPGTTLGFNLGTAPLSTTSTGLTFPAATATSTPTLSFGVGTSLTTTSTAAPAFGLSAAPAFGLPAATTAVTSSAPSAVPTLGGLGGATSFNIGKTTSLATKPDQLKANPLTSLTAAPNQTQAPNYKDELIPPQLMTLVESFKTFVKDQKSSSSIVNRASLKQINKVTEDAELLKRMTLQLERTVNKNKALNKKLREDVARGIQDSEVVQRLSMDPRGFPTDNTLAFEYFRTIVDRFQHQAESLTVELKSMEKHIVSKLHPSPFTPEELSVIMKQLYECFVALAGRYQSIHSSVTSLKLDLQRKNDPWYALNSMGYYQSNTLLK
uniref:Nucleoporin p58/p45 n=1 Tax=Lygus hesperus TaxID=30085 RepID=A0A0A9WLH3_LYGHE